MRCFVAVEVGGQPAKSLAQLIGRISNSGADCSCASPGQLHVTLAFLGEKNGSQVSGIISSLEKIRAEPLGFGVRGAGILPNDSFARVFYAGVEATPSLLELQKKVVGALGPHYPREERRFLPHVTLARIKSRKNLSELVSLKNSAAGEDFGETCVESFFLKKSLLAPSGAVYENVREFPLKPSR